MTEETKGVVDRLIARMELQEERLTCRLHEMETTLIRRMVAGFITAGVHISVLQHLS